MSCRTWSPRFCRTVSWLTVGSLRGLEPKIDRLHLNYNDTTRIVPVAKRYLAFRSSQGSSPRNAGAPGAAVYVASKHAVEGLTKAAALEVAESGVRVNVVAPGPIDTGMLARFTATEENKAGLVSTVPMKRMGRPEEIAQTIVFLASDKASFITGASVAVDGGKLAR
jgi:NAD(P)-dependent dehydrogenase (short-subunit alcohol dehydrogenase family)